jgi:hypothetical protein
MMVQLDDTIVYFMIGVRCVTNTMARRADMMVQLDDTIVYFMIGVRCVTNTMVYSTGTKQGH